LLSWLCIALVTPSSQAEGGANGWASPAAETVQVGAQHAGGSRHGAGSLATLSTHTADWRLAGLTFTALTPSFAQRAERYVGGLHRELGWQLRHGQERRGGKSARARTALAHVRSTRVARSRVLTAAAARAQVDGRRVHAALARVAHEVARRVPSACAWLMRVPHRALAPPNTANSDLRSFPETPPFSAGGEPAPKPTSAERDKERERERPAERPSDRRVAWTSEASPSSAASPDDTSAARSPPRLGFGRPKIVIESGDMVEEEAAPAIATVPFDDGGGSGGPAGDRPGRSRRATLPTLDMDAAAISSVPARPRLQLRVTEEEDDSDAVSAAGVRAQSPHGLRLFSGAKLTEDR
jgi:hypothetical protein